MVEYKTLGGCGIRGRFSEAVADGGYRIERREHVEPSLAGDIGSRHDALKMDAR